MRWTGAGALAQPHIRLSKPLCCKLNLAYVHMLVAGQLATGDCKHAIFRSALFLVLFFVFFFLFFQYIYRLVAGQLATGDCKHAILRCKHVEGAFAVDGGAYAN